MKSNPRISMGLFLVIGLIAACVSKPSAQQLQDDAQRLKNAGTVVKYTTELDICKALGKDAGSYEVYEKCATAVDVDAGKKGVQ